MNLSEYGERDLNPKWIRFLESISPNLAEKVSVCRKEFSGWADVNGHKFNRATLCQQRDACPVCSMVYTMMLTGDAVELVSRIAFATGGSVRFASAEFTLPREAQAKVDESDLSGLRRMAWEVLERVLGVYGEDGKRRYVIGGVGASHCWHSENPWKGWFPHDHITVSDVCYDKKSEAFGRNQLFLSSEQLMMMRELWRQKFEDRYGRTMAKCFDVHWRYSQGQGRLRHRIAYQSRRAVSDCYKTSFRSDFPAGINREWAERLLFPPKNWKGLQWYGMLSDGVKAKYLKKLDITLEKKAVRDKERRKAHCPKCGSELYCYRHGVGYDELVKEGDGCMVLAYPRKRRAGR